MFGDSMPTVLEEGAQRETGENSRMASFMGAFAICDLVKTTLGPKGMDKILQPMGGGQVQITNDGATILQQLDVQVRAQPRSTRARPRPAPPRPAPPR